MSPLATGVVHNLLDPAGCVRRHPLLATLVTQRGRHLSDDNDADASGEFEGWLEWTPGICGKKDPSAFGVLCAEAK